MLARVALVAVALAGCETERGLLIEIDSPVAGARLHVIVAGTHLVPDDAQGAPGRWLDLGPITDAAVVGRDLTANPYRYLITGAAEEPPDTTPLEGEVLVDDERVVIAAVLYEAELPIAFGVLPTPLGVPDDYVALHRLTLVPVQPNLDPNCLSRGSLVVGTDPGCGVLDDCAVDPNGVDCPEVCVDDPPIGTVVYEVCDGRDNNCDPAAQHTSQVLCYTVDGTCSLGAATCDDQMDGQGVVDNCTVVGDISPTTETGQFEESVLCDAYDACAGSPDRVACAHAALALETLVCEPRYDSSGSCEDFHAMTKGDANNCTLSILADVPFPGWRPTIDGSDASSAFGCAVALSFDEPQLGNSGLHSESLLVRSYLDAGMGNIQDFVRVIIAPKMVQGQCGAPIDACTRAAP